MTYNDAIKIVSQELNLPIDAVDIAYKSYWKFIRSIIKELPLKTDLTEEEFKCLKTNFNIPSLGKLACTYKKLKGEKERYKHYKKNKKLKYGN